MRSKNNPIFYKLQNYQMENTENEIHRLPYQAEQFLIDCVKTGDLNALSSAPNADLSTYSIGKLAYSEFKQQEYASVSLVSIVTRAAIEAGVNPYECYDLSDIFLQQISNVTSISDFNKINIEIVRTFVLHVHEMKKKQNPHFIKECETFIHHHLNKEFTLSDLAAHVSMNAPYLSEQFHRYTGQTIKDYTLTSRIDAAKNMLKYSDYSISEISSYLCFHSQSYFGKVFKSYVNYTPSVYRKLFKIF